jgi:hypothetical protein
MSLGIAFKGPEGIVLAADSRVTLTVQVPGQPFVVPATYDNATKLLNVADQKYVGVVTYGAGTIGLATPRTAHSYLPEFEAEVATGEPGRLSVGDFARRLSDFFIRQWTGNMPADYAGSDMVFLVGGYDEGEPYGRVFEIFIPSRPQPHEVSEGNFGIVWGGQREVTDRILQGFDPALLPIVQQAFALSDQQRDELENHLKGSLSIPIPYPFLPLQDCVDLSIFLIRTTITIQKWSVGIRGVGGAIDVATITRTDGYHAIQKKEIEGELRSV